MNEKNKLNLSDGWEAIVNDADRHNARERRDMQHARRRRSRMIGKCVDLMLGAVACMALSVAELLVGWLAVPAAIVLLCGACVMAGRVLEQYRRGW